jgi:hypothetical protein
MERIHSADMWRRRHVQPNYVWMSEQFQVGYFPSDFEVHTQAFNFFAIQDFDSDFVPGNNVFGRCLLCERRRK